VRNNFGQTHQRKQSGIPPAIAAFGFHKWPAYTGESDFGFILSNGPYQCRAELIARGFPGYQNDDH
jgi:hypothetical protein